MNQALPQAASAAKFDTSRAAEYETQSRIALAGYDACHELAACLLAASLDAGPKSVLIGGAGGTGQEILATARLRPQWKFTAADPSAPMLDQTMDRIAAAGLSAQVQAAPCAVQDLPAGTVFDAATLIGVLHHVPDDADKLQLLQALSARLAPGAPFILACNRHRYDSEPLLLEAWAMRWRMAGVDEAAVHAKLGKIRQGAVPPASEEAVEQMLAQAGFVQPKRFFSSLFWCAWIAFKA
ncbi:tRNA (cmo5U34)-methyltransferase|uniref:class I SAM-dependent methyltransferase n=1 Tax=Delftia acidovorans TaxID=80866 RepID=UPI001C0AD9BC|nr:class I SAM-dependent methyltransferase [Delftia acidovorans]MCA1071977.1 tRNA (cmo5U34)-methyltransferase [Delftia acidovorans]